MEQLSKFENIIIQLGISALVILVVGIIGLKVASKIIDKWAEGDKARTKEIADGFKAITESHARVLETVNENHTHVLESMNKHQADELQVIAQFRVELTRIDQKVSTALDLTPVRGFPKVDPPASVIVDRSQLDEEVPTPQPKKRAQTQPGVRTVTEYGPFNTPHPKKG